MEHLARHGVVALGLAAMAGCGDNFLDPFVTLVRVSGDTAFGEGCAGPQPGKNFDDVEVEPSLAIDPTNPRHLVAAWQQDRWSNGGADAIGAAASFDGGATWLTSTPRFGRCSGAGEGSGAAYERATDPWVTFAADGTAYVMALVFDATSARDAMLASRSSDGGVTWGDAAVLLADADADVFNDKNTITGDPVEPGRVYATWDRLTGATRPMEPVGTGAAWFARTTDGVWEPARAIFDPGLDAQTIGNVIAVLPDGSLVDVFNVITGISGNASRSALAVIRSDDKGQTWSAATEIAPLESAGVEDPNNRVAVRSGGLLPQIAVDRASGALYVVWQGIVGAGRDGVLLARSLDGGVTWSAPQQVNGAPRPAFSPVVAVASDGTIGVMYFDLRDGRPGELDAFRVRPWLATSRDGGATWSDEALSEPFDLRPALLENVYFLGDYHGLVAAGDVFVPLFAAANPRSGNRTDVFVRPVR